MFQFFLQLRHVTRKSVFGDQIRFKQACSAREARNHESLNLVIIIIILCRRRTTKVLIRLHRCAISSAPLLFAYDKNGFSHDMAQL